jgi:hypothetical protein
MESHEVEAQKIQMKANQCGCKIAPNFLKRIMGLCGSMAGTA